MPQYSNSIFDQVYGYDPSFIPNGIAKSFHKPYRSIRTKIRLVVFFLALIVGCYSLKSYINDVQQKVDSAAAQYNTLHWRPVDAKIITLGPIMGTERPVKQSVVVEYPQGEFTQQLTLDVQLGYHQNDLVQLYVNDKGEYKFRGLDITHFSTFTEFWGDFFTTWLIVIFFEMVFVWATLYALIMAVVVLLYRLKSSRNAPEVSQLLH